MSKRIPRLEMNELAPNVQETLAARVKRLGYLGEFFKCSGHNPDVLVSFMEMTEALKEALPDRLTEVGSLTVAGLMGNAYERHQHERLSEKLGFGRDWVASVNRLQPDEAGPMSEDALRVNVWTPSTTGKRPVMVWFHGGAFYVGSGSLPIFNGEALARRGAIVAKYIHPGPWSGSGLYGECMYDVSERKFSQVLRDIFATLFPPYHHTVVIADKISVTFS